jgi:hypothetical protein
MTDTIPTPAVLDTKRGKRAAEALLAHVRDVREQADAVLTMTLDDISWDDAVRIAHEIKMAKEALGAAEEFVAKHAASVWPAKWKDKQTVPGVGRAQPYRPGNTRWSEDEVLEDVVEKRMAELGGEMPDPMAVVRWVQTVAKLGYFRVGKLEELGLKPNDYRHTEYGSVRLRIESDDVIGATTHG